MASEADDVAARLRAEFPRALRDGQLIGYFQPEVELSTGRLVAAELLARWEHPELGTLQPSSFISLAEELGLMTEFSLEMLRQALVQHRAWAAAGWLVPVSVNIGPGCVADPDFPAAVARLLARGAGARPDDRARGERGNRDRRPSAPGSSRSWRSPGSSSPSMTSAPASPPWRASAAGRSTSSSWTARSCARSSRSTSFRTIVRTTIDLAHQLGVKVVGEGVESAAISSELQALGCDIGQGFYLGRPMSAAAFTEWLRDPARLVLPVEASGYPQPSPQPRRADPGGLVSAPVGRAVGALRGDRCSRSAVGTLAAAVLVLVVYGLWQMFRWGGRAHQALIGDLAFVPVNGAAVVLAWRVSRRADLGHRTCRAWRLLSLAMFLYLLGDLLQFWVENVMHRRGLPRPGPTRPTWAST